MKMKDLSISVLILMVLFLVSCKNSSNKKSQTIVSDAQILEVASKAYVYGYPLLLMDYTNRIGINVEEPNSFGSAPINQIGHFRQFPDHNFTDVVKPNVDTYYSIAWYDLKQEPIVLSVPATDRYYLLPLLDAYTNVFSVPGTRTTGKEAQSFLLAGPFWQGEVPEGMTLIQAPTNMVWMIGRTQVNSLEDGATVVASIQDGYKLVPLSHFGKEYIPPKGTVSEEVKNIVPVSDVRALSIEDYFNLLSELMVDNPPAPADSTLIEEMASIGIIPGQSFSTENFNQEVKQKLESIPEKVHNKWESMGKNENPDMVKDGWIFMTQGMGSYGTNYDFRAFIAFFGLGANLPEDAIYPSSGKDSNNELLDGAKKYVIHFTKEQIPPVNAFWSLTAYDKRNLLVENPINRYALGDRDNLKYNKDGSLDIYIQNTSIGKDKEANWLPSPKEGPMNLTLRLYWPKPEVLDGSWTIPAIQKVK